MSGSRQLSEVQELRKSLAKAIEAGEAPGKVMDILKALEKAPFTPDIVKESKIGKTLMAAKQKYSAEPLESKEVTELAHGIMVRLKKLVEEHLVEKGKKAAPIGAPPPKSTPNGSKSQDKNDLQHAIANYPEGRKKVR
jgi:TFIIS helical bundle-like domain